MKNIQPGPGKQYSYKKESVRNVLVQPLIITEGESGAG